MDTYDSTPLSAGIGISVERIRPRTAGCGCPGDRTLRGCVSVFSSFPSSFLPSNVLPPLSSLMKEWGPGPLTRLTGSLGWCRRRGRGWALGVAGSRGGVMASKAAKGLPVAAAGGRSEQAEGGGCWPRLSCSIESTPQHYLSPHFPSVTTTKRP